MHQVAYGNTDIFFELKRSNRKTMAIEVHPDNSVQVIAPEQTKIEAIKDRVLKRAQWIVKQQQYFEQFLPRTPEREYVSGEIHLYLGKRYLLKVRKADKQEVKLKGGELLVFGKDVSNTVAVKNALAEWYYRHAERKFNQLFKEVYVQFKKHKIGLPQIEIKRMEKRWGSFTSSGKILINPEIIKAPTRCIQYVITHEMCHAIHPNHSKLFYDLQNEIMPDWEKWKDRLEKSLF